MTFTENKEGVRAIGDKIQKICGRKIYSRTRNFGAEVHESNIRIEDGTKSMRIVN